MHKTYSRNIIVKTEKPRINRGLSNKLHSPHVIF